ncbi:MAG: GNAT family N-acetyltransferase [Burkholderiaceae bacterium]
MPFQLAAHDNPLANRYEIEVDGQVATADYIREATGVTFTHTFVPEPLRGRGLATRLILAALDDARRAGLQVVPQCAAFAAYMKTHPETQDLLSPAGRRMLDE